MTAQLEYIIPICGIVIYTIGFTVVGYKGLRRRWAWDIKSQGVSSWMSLTCIYVVPVMTCIDFFSDVSVTIKWLGEDGTRSIGMLGISILLGHRVLSALVFAEKYGWWTGVRQFFDLEMFKTIYLSVKYNRKMYGLMEHKMLEGLMESFPQLLMQTYYVVKRQGSHDANKYLLHFSIMSSLFSLASCYMFTDIVGIHEDGFLCLRENEAKEPDPNRIDAKQILNNLCCYGCLWIWRIGEVSTRMSVFVAYAAVVSARYGTLLICVVQLTFNYILIECQYPESRKATMFYLSPQEPKEDDERDEQKETCTSLDMINIEDQKGVNEKEMDERIRMRHSLREMSTEKEETICGKFFFKTILGFGGIFFAMLALPSLTPKYFVLEYYVFKIIFEGFLIGRCLWFTGISNGVVYTLKNEVLQNFWWYWAIGALAFLFGGMLSCICVINTKRWEEVLEADERFLLKLMKDERYSHVERVVRNGVCTIEQIREKALSRMDEIDLIDFEKNEPFCDLLCRMIRQRILQLRPKDRKLTKKMAKRRKYMKFVVPALLRQYDESRWQSKECDLAKLVFNRLVTEQLDNAPIFLFEDLRDAGASLTFLRFHLKVEESLFRKNGTFGCTAEELEKEKFDLLFCLRCGFSPEELIEAGFVKDHVNHLASLDDWDDSKLKDLEEFEDELFEMHFTVEQLKKAKFTNAQILGWFNRHMGLESTLKLHSPKRLSEFTVSHLTKRETASKKRYGRSSTQVPHKKLGKYKPMDLKELKTIDGNDVTEYTTIDLIETKINVERDVYSASNDEEKV